MKALILITALACVIGCTKKNPMNDKLGAVNSEVETSAPTAELEKPSIEMPREGVAFEILREDCFKVANEAILSTEEAEAICLNANPYSQNCLEKGLEVSLLRSSIAVICANAREGSATCLHEARIKDQKVSEEIGELCK